jgi:hypothetical protein
VSSGKARNRAGAIHCWLELPTRIADFKKGQEVVPGIQLARAGRKGSVQRPWLFSPPLQGRGGSKRRVVTAQLDATRLKLKAQT